MECKFAVICKFYQQEDKPCVLSAGRVLDVELPLPDGRKPEPKVKRHSVHKKFVPIIFPTNQEKKDEGVRHCKKCDFVSTGKTEGESKAQIMAHYKKEHPKAKTAGRKPGKKVVLVLKPASDQYAEQSFKTLQKRANKGKLTEEQTTVFDNLEPEIIGLPVSKWPDGYKEQVIKLFNDVLG